MLLDQRDGFEAILALPDDADFRKTLEEKVQLVARGTLVVNDDGLNRHTDCQYKRRVPAPARSAGSG